MEQLLKNSLLSLLDKFVQVCNEHHLHYYLAYGTALGAVRHKGFIPWDDDVDVHMPREDYERLQQLPSEIWGKYKLTSWRNTPKYIYHFLKVEDTQTTLIEQINSLYIGGVYIDIFPIDTAPADSTILAKQASQIRVLEDKYYTLSVRYGRDYKGVVNYIHYLIRRLIYSRQNIQDQIDNIAKQYIGTTNQVIDYYWLKDWHNMPVPEEWFGEGRAVNFEGRKYIVPENYDAYLTHIYGDYITPPPEDKREGHEYLYVNLNKRVSDKELKVIVRELRKKVAFRFSWMDELNYWKIKLKIK